MHGKPVKLDNWMYSPEKIVTLAAISKPYRRDGRYCVELKFLPENKRPYERLFSDYTLLIKDGKYMNGLFQPEESEKTVHLNLSFTDANKPKPYYNAGKFDNDRRFGRYTFGFSYNGEFYILPLDVLIRDILTPDAELLNILTSFDVKDGKFLHFVENGVFNLQILSDFPRRYVEDDEKIRHLAWLFSNPGIERMLSQTYQNICNGEGILFDWGFDHLKIEAVVRQYNGKNFIQRITHITKRIQVNEITVNDARDVKYEGEGEYQVNHNRIMIKAGEELSIHGGGASVDMSDWMPNPVEVKYETMPKIVRSQRKKQREKTLITNLGKMAVIGDGRRTTGEPGSEEKVPELIFQQHSTYTYEDEFAYISDVLTIIEKNKLVSEVQSYVAPLNVHTDMGTFRYLSDGQTDRCYFAGKIIFSDGLEAVTLDIQRENRCISMLLIISKNGNTWDGIIHTIMKNTVEESGYWPSDTLAALQNEFHLRIERCKHTTVEAKQRAKNIMFKCEY